MIDTLNGRLDQLSSLVDLWTRHFQERVGIEVEPLRQMIGYHLGWADADLHSLAQPLPGGKRLRPALALLTSEAVCGRIEPAAAPAVAVELVHNFSLVHDDIQDGSALRRHRPTVWSLWGTPQAINVGDGLFALAQLALTSPDLSQPRPELVVEGVRRLNRTCLALVEGQFLDLELQEVGQVTLPEYQRMVAGKTAALLECACELGALYAQAAPETVAAYGAFGQQLGLAFQYQDDLLGVWGESAVTGKPYASDLRSRKKGLPAALAFDRLGGADEQRWRALYQAAGELSHARGAGELSDAEVEEALSILERSPVREAAEQMVEQGFERALALLDRAAHGGARPVDQLADLCRHLRTRQF